MYNLNSLKSAVDALEIAVEQLEKTGASANGNSRLKYVPVATTSEELENAASAGVAVELLNVGNSPTIDFSINSELYDGLYIDQRIGGQSNSLPADASNPYLSNIYFPYGMPEGKYVISVREYTLSDRSLWTNENWESYYEYEADLEEFLKDYDVSTPTEKKAAHTYAEVSYGDNGRMCVALSHEYVATQIVPNPDDDEGSNTIRNTVWRQYLEETTDGNYYSQNYAEEGEDPDWSDVGLSDDCFDEIGYPRVNNEVIAGLIAAGIRAYGHYSGKGYKMFHRVVDGGVWNDLDDDSRLNELEERIYELQERMSDDDGDDEGGDVYEDGITVNEMLYINRKPNWSGTKIGSLAIMTGTPTSSYQSAFNFNCTNWVSGKFRIYVNDDEFPNRVLRLVEGQVYTIAYDEDEERANMTVVRNGTDLTFTYELYDNGEIVEKTETVSFVTDNAYIDVTLNNDNGIGYRVYALSNDWRLGYYEDAGAAMLIGRYQRVYTMSEPATLWQYLTVENTNQWVLLGSLGSLTGGSDNNAEE